MLIALPIILVHGGAVQIHTNWHDWDVKLLIAAWVNTFKTNLKDTTKTDIKVLSNANIAPLFVRRNLWWYRDWPVPVTALSKAFGLRPLDRWDCGFEYRGGRGSWEVCVLSGRGLWDRPITHSEESYRLWCTWVLSWNFNNKEGLAH